MKILITGATGFVGSHLVEYCLTKRSVRLYGTFLHGAPPKKKGIVFLKCDLSKKNQLRSVLAKTKPNVIFHLAGQSRVSLSWASPEKTVLHNIASDLNLFEAAKELGLDAVIVTAGSSEEYGLTFASELPIKETNPLRPMSPYAVSKIAQEKLAFQYHKTYGMKTVLVRCFNTEGPGRPEEFVTSAFAKQIALIEKKKQKPVMKVGNLEARRDFTDVRDVARAYWLAAHECKFGEPYNVCSGKARPVAAVLETLIRLSTVKNIKVVKDVKKMRPSDIPVTVGDNKKFKNQTGWKPQISFETTMEDLLNYWRARI